MRGFPQFRNLVEMTAHRAAQYGEREVLSWIAENGVCKDGLTFSGLHENATRIAAGLTQQGLSGRNLMLLYAPSLDYINAFFGCLYAGCVPVPAYPPMGARDINRLKRVAADCDAGAILSSSMLLPMIEAWVGNPSNGLSVPCIATDTLASQTDAIGFVPYQSDPADIAFLQYTSGSTGHPKGVMVSHQNLIANFQQIVWGFAQEPDVDKVGREYKLAIWLPPFHDMGLIGGVLTPVYAGAQVFLMSPLTFLKDPYVWLKTISEQKVKISGGPNFSYQHCVRKVREEKLAELDLSSWEVAFNGAEPIQTASMNAFADRFSVCGFNAKAFFPCYGLAEATLFVSGTPTGRGSGTLLVSLEQLGQGKVSVQQPDTRPASKIVDTLDLVSSGVPAMETDIRIVNPQTGQSCQQGEVGEIWVNSPSVASGYWNKPAYSDSVFRARIKDDPDSPAYMRTGDLGVLWDNELYVTGRIKELIIVAGRNHYPQDIELSLQEANPVFRKGCGAAFASREQGKEGLVVIQEVASAAGDQTDYQQLALAGAKAIAVRHGVMPSELVFINSGSLPKTSSGKIQRTEAKKFYDLGNFTPLHVWSSNTRQNAGTAAPLSSAIQKDDYAFTDWQSELYSEMQKWVGDKLNCEAHLIDLDVTFSELGVDSIEAIDLVDRLQDRIERTIPATELMRYPTVKALIDHFAEELNEKDQTRRQAAEPAAENTV